MTYHKSKEKNVLLPIDLGTGRLFLFALTMIMMIMLPVFPLTTREKDAFTN